LLVDKVLVILAGCVFAASIVVITRVKQRMEAKGRARRWQEREELFRHRRHRSTGGNSGGRARVNGQRPAHGTIVALLAESYPDRIEVGGRTLLLRAGETCPYTAGTTLRVVYTVVGGQPLVDGVMAVRPPE
jgi:hypothetical protein